MTEGLEFLISGMIFGFAVGHLLSLFLLWFFLRLYLFVKEGLNLIGLF